MRLISEIFTLPVKVVDGFSSEFDVVHDLSSDGSYCLISELDDKEEANAIAMALNSYDENQEFIKKQQEQINRFADKVIKQQEQIEELEAQSEWISVDDFTSSNCYVYACCNDITSSWVELLYMDADKEFFFPHGTRYPAIVDLVMPIELPTPPNK